MLVENVTHTPFGKNQIRIEWVSETVLTRSWIFINGLFVVGPYMSDATKRSVILTVPTDRTLCIEVHDFEDDTVPDPCVQKPLVRPMITFNDVNEATSYRIYHKQLDSNEYEVLLAEIPARVGPMEVMSPIVLNGHNGHWHSFRVEAVNKYHRESVNDLVYWFAVDFPVVPRLTVIRDVTSGLLTFRIV